VEAGSEVKTTPQLYTTMQPIVATSAGRQMTKLCRPLNQPMSPAPCSPEYQACSTPDRPSRGSDKAEQISLMYVTLCMAALAGTVFGYWLGRQLCSLGSATALGAGLTPPCDGQDASSLCFNPTMRVRVCASAFSNQSVCTMCEPTDLPRHESTELQVRQATE